MEKNNNTFKIIGALIIGAVLMYAVIYAFPQSFSTIVTKTEEEVTITDNGIADAVDKIYDAVVVVSAYNDNTLYSSGTGFVYKIEGDKAYILTNAHVIDGTNKVNVTFTNEEEITTEIIGYNEYEDIAVLTVNKDEIIKIAEIGNNDEVRVGDTAFAVGAPLDSAFSWTVTRGIVSGKDRYVEVSVNSTNTTDYIMSVIQTDAAINSGNSGGPLCNSNGEVIGINTLKLAEEGVEGMGFAIPIEHAIDTAESIISGEDENPYLGIGMLDIVDIINSNEYKSIIEDANVEDGVLLTVVENNSSASAGGLKINDIITEINGKAIESANMLRYELYKHDIGETIEISYIRDGKEYTTDIELKAKVDA